MAYQSQREAIPVHRLIFGARCSPSTVIFVLQKTAADFALNQMIENLAKNSFYMDDFVHSFETVEIAQEAAVSLKKTLMRAGLNLTKFVSNEQTAIDNANDGDENSKDCHRVLDVQWNKSTDKIFHHKPSKFDTKADIYTVRKLLSLIACLFDPLGIIAPVIITLIIILQEIWKEGLARDDHLPQEKSKSIQTWIDNYMCSPPIEVPRCLTLDVATSKTFELHVFTDASQLAYGAVAYARIISEHGVSCCFLMSKAKVAPIKQLSIPKLELQAAVLGTRLAHFIKKHHTIEFKDTTIWCDSMSVLA